MFKLKENKTKISTEILAGITTFLTMAYILAVNPDMLSMTGMPMQSVFLATALSAAVASILMGLLANYPVALAPGMGVNAFFTFTVVFTYGYSWQTALAAVFVSGVIFLIISITRIRKAVINAIPKSLKLAIGAGIGFFIAFIGFQNAGIIVMNEATLVSFGSFKAATTLLSIVGIFITLILLSRKVPAAVFFGLVATALIGVGLGMAGVAGMPQLPTQIISTSFDFSTAGAFVSGFKELFTKPDLLLVIFTLLFIDFFDTAGTLLAVAQETNLIEEDGELKNVDRALIADAVGTVVGAGLGTSTVTSYVESASGVGVGGRTGLTAVTTGIMFILSIFFFPLLAMITPNVTAPALVVVGIFMAQQLKGIEWDNFNVASSSFVTIIVMILAYSISDGIAAGFLVYGTMQLFSGKAKETNYIIWILMVIFLIHFII